jgi:NAD(P)-dependent dehydrogenase (short-subunit alcohol dehydrogenase family)
MDEPTRVALVTGGNRGLGLEVSRQLASRGITVVLAARAAEMGARAAAGLEERGLAVEFCRLDVTEEASIEQAARYLDDRHGRLDILVNNAGAIFDPRDEAAEQPSGVLGVAADALRQSFAVNAIGVALCCKHLVPLMLRHDWGRVVNVSTSRNVSLEMGDRYPGYRMAKVALNELTVLLAEELADRGVKVNAACPGWVRTDLGGAGATRSVEEGADTIVWLATLHDDGPSGGFFRDCKRVGW